MDIWSGMLLVVLGIAGLMIYHTVRRRRMAQERARRRAVRNSNIMWMVEQRQYLDEQRRAYRMAHQGKAFI